MFIIADILWDVFILCKTHGALDYSSCSFLEFLLLTLQNCPLCWMFVHLLELFKHGKFLKMLLVLDFVKTVMILISTPSKVTHEILIKHLVSFILLNDLLNLTESTFGSSLLHGLEEDVYDFIFRGWLKRTITNCRIAKNWNMSWFDVAFHLDSSFGNEDLQLLFVDVTIARWR